MRKLISLSLGVALVSTIFVAVPAAAAPAEMEKGNLSQCGMPGADAEGNFIFGGVGTMTRRVVNKNHAMMTCESVEITNDSGSAVEFSGFDCGVTLPDGEMIWTTDSHATITSWGRAKLTCKAALPAA